MVGAVLLAVTVAFPRPGQTLPYVSRTYMSGAVERGASDLTVQGRPVEIYKTGGWVTMVDVSEGENSVEIVSGGIVTNVTVKVEKKPVPKLDADGNPLPPPPPRVYEKLPYASDEPQKHPRGKKPCDTLLFLDPGHGGSKDTGAVSPHGFFEKDANLALAKDVRTELLKMGYRVEMTREGDVALQLTERPRKACEMKADAFVSIHHNAPACTTDPRKVRYTAVYAWNGIGEGLAGPISARMGKAVAPEIANNGVLHANFAVTRNPQVPSCLVEADFITTPEGELDIWTVSRRRKLASAIAAGIDDWCRQN
ncbi:MAG: N-acetylmuramoyl-L-alanine amidase [Kiritimatiellae bacterium]|nr:N-acetylmuramoyl-L-alanine amidase [Kiritimatiellia bacterium]